MKALWGFGLALSAGIAIIATAGFISLAFTDEGMLAVLATPFLAFWWVTYKLWSVRDEIA